MKKPKESLLSPEKFVLEKDVILRLLQKVKEHWQRDDFNEKQNSQYEALMVTSKLSIKYTDLEVLRVIWFGMNFFIDEIRTLNALTLTANESKTEKQYDAAKKLLDIEWHRIESGEIFIEN